MAFLQKKNNAKTTLSEDIAVGETAWDVADASVFPASGDFLLTCWDDNSYPNPADDPNMEIVRCTGVAGNTLTVTKNQESTGDNAHSSGDTVAMLITAGTFDDAFDQNLKTTDSPTFVDSALSDMAYGTPTYTSLHDWAGTTQSSGLISGGVISDAGGGNINVTAGCGMAKTADTEISPTVFVDFAARNGIAIANDGNRYTVYVDYDASPAVLITNNPTADVDHTTKFAIGSVFYDGTTMHVLNEAGTRIYNLARRTHHRARQLRGFERASGLVTGDEGTLHFSITNGVVYAGLNQLSITGIDTSGTDTFDAWYYDGDLGGGADWVETTGNTQLDAVQYNDVATGLANLGTNRYGVHWVFMDVDSHCNVVYGQGNYKLIEAQNAVVPASLPPLVNQFAILVARVIVQEGNAEIVEIGTAFDTLFATATAPDHGELAGLADDDHTQYMPVESARTLTNSSTVLIDEIDWTGSDIGNQGYAPYIHGAPTVLSAGIGVLGMLAVIEDGSNDPSVTFVGDTLDFLKSLSWDIANARFDFCDNVYINGNIGLTGTVDGIDIATDVAANTTHRGSDGSDHSFIDQSVISGATPTFTGTNITAVASVTAADESADTTCFPCFFTAATGTVSPKTGTNLTFNSSTGLLTATSFAGNLTGNVTGNVSGSSGSCTGNAATATLASTITVADESADTSCYVGYFTAASGSLAAKTGSNLTFNSSTGLLTATHVTVSGGSLRISTGSGDPQIYVANSTAYDDAANEALWDFRTTGSSSGYQIGRMRVWDTDGWGSGEDDGSLLQLLYTSGTISKGATDSCMLDIVNSGTIIEASFRAIAVRTTEKGTINFGVEMDGTVHIVDNKEIFFGTDNDAYILWNTSDSELQIVAV